MRNIARVNRPTRVVLTTLALVPTLGLGPIARAAPPAAPLPVFVQRTAPPEGPVEAVGDDAEAPMPDGIDAPREVADFADPFAVALAPVQGGLTSNEVASRATATAPSVMAAQADLEAAAAVVDQTIIQFLPQLRADAGYTRLSPVDINFGSGALVGTANEGPLVTAPCDPMLGLPAGSTCVVDAGGGPAFAASAAFPLPLNNWSLQASLGVPISDYVLSLLPASKAAKRAESAAETFAEAERLKVEIDARVAYYNWIKALALQTVAEQSLDRSRARLADAEASFSAGTTSKSDVMRLDATVARTEATLVDAQAFVDLAAANLAVIMGESGQPTFAIGEDILGPVPPFEDLRSLDELVDEAWSQRLELRSLEYNREAIDYGVRATRANYFPRISAFAEATYANPNQRFFPATQDWNGSWSAGLQLTWVINETLLTRSKIKELRANERKVEANVEALRRGVRLEVTQSYKDRQRALAALELNARALASAEEAYRVAVDLYQVGNATTTDILNAELGLVNATLDDISSRIDARIANAKLEYATGRTAKAPAGDSNAKGR